MIHRMREADCDLGVQASVAFIHLEIIEKGASEGTEGEELGRRQEPGRRHPERQ